MEEESWRPKEKTTEQKIWKAAAAIIRSLRPLLLYLILPALVASLGMLITGRQDNTQRFVHQSGRFYKTLGIVLTFVILERSARKRGSSIAKETTLKWEKPDIGKLFLLFGLGVGVSLFLSAAFTFLPPSIGQGYATASQAAFSGTDLGLAIVSALVLAPVLEEVIFRGYMLNRLFDGFEQKGALLVSSLIFALCHISPLWILYAFGMGILLACVAVWEDNILYSIMLHAGFNFLSVPTLFINQSPEASEFIFGNPWIISAYGLIGLCLALYLWKMYRRNLGNIKSGYGVF
ncbi:MAG: CPBP family intramembrane glutamic endopeptidase [Clostridium sp.]